jgi:hypothetical protein
MASTNINIVGVEMLVDYDLGLILYAEDSQDRTVFNEETHSMAPNESSVEAQEVEQLATRLLRHHLVKNGKHPSDLTHLLQSGGSAAMLKAVVDLHYEKKFGADNALASLSVVLSMVVSGLKKRKAVLATIEQHKQGNFASGLADGR